MILPKYRQIVDPEYVQALLKTLSDDILFMRKDREVEIEFFLAIQTLPLILITAIFIFEKYSIKIRLQKDPEKPSMMLSMTPLKLLCGKNMLISWKWTSKKHTPILKTLIHSTNALA